MSLGPKVLFLAHAYKNKLEKQIKVLLVQLKYDCAGPCHSLFVQNTKATMLASKLDVSTRCRTFSKNK